MCNELFVFLCVIIYDVHDFYGAEVLFWRFRVLIFFPLSGYIIFSILHHRDIPLSCMSFELHYFWLLSVAGRWMRRNFFLSHTI